ncbi:serine/threonine-protein kinase fhke-related [Anaeramoeba flamelloides]|uniref:Serine/threonine-protein kinase fhke-related n=1 Tax=Anaeramoeba flamelloides TaxID=1746091 RepID=A0ABQ8XW62_9EUKA|nr:serine/threonine-protein kinase fhke-related [Anaeramoeba flamelloides]
MSKSENKKEKKDEEKNKNSEKGNGNENKETLLFGMLNSTVEGVENIPLYKDQIVVIGRNKQSTCVLSDGGISGKHCTIEFQAKENKEKNNSPNPKLKVPQYNVILEDFSSNGTFLNGFKLGKGNRRMIYHSDTISFGEPKGWFAQEKEIAKFIFEDYNVISPERMNCQILSLYDLKHQLGKGHYATVQLGVHKSTGENFAIKIVAKDQFKKSLFGRNRLMDEAKVMKRISHPNIVNVKDIHETENYLYLVLELVKGGELIDRIIKKGSFSEEESRVVFLQLLDVVKYLHSQGIVHRDLKPENILLTSQESDTDIKVADFGLSRIIESNQNMITQIGTINYIAPEVLERQWQGGYGKECDYWSLGVILYIMLTGVMPFTNEKNISVTEQITKIPVDFPSQNWDNISIAAKHLVKRLLTIKVEERINVEDCYQHPWVLNQSYRITDECQKEYHQISEQKKIQFNESRKKKNSPKKIQKKKSNNLLTQQSTEELDFGANNNNCDNKNNDSGDDTEEIDETRKRKHKTKARKVKKKAKKIKKKKEKQKSKKVKHQKKKSKKNSKSKKKK